MSKIIAEFATKCTNNVDRKVFKRVFEFETEGLYDYVTENCESLGLLDDIFNESLPDEWSVDDVIEPTGSYDYDRNKIDFKITCDMFGYEENKNEEESEEESD